MNLILIYLEFFKTGMFAVGGGLATVPFLFRMANDHFTFIRQTGWLSTEQVGNFLAIAQCSPGAIGVNIATQVGFLYGGTAGSIAAAMGLTSPAIIAITIIAKTLQSIKENKITDSIFKGLRPAATGLLGAAGWGVWRLALYNPGYNVWHEIIRWREGIVCMAIFALVVKFKFHPIIYIAMGAASGILFGF